MDFAVRAVIVPLPQRGARSRRHVRAPTKRRNAVRLKPPTHFLALRLPSAALHQRGKDVQSDVLRAAINDPDAILSHAIVDTRKLHLTLFVMRLTNALAVERARSVLRSCKQDAAEAFATDDPKVELRGISTFRHEVLFIECAAETVPSLRAFHNSVFKKFKNAGIVEGDEQSKTFKPHATLMKKSQASRKIRKKAQRKALRKLRLQVPENYNTKSTNPASFFGVHPLHYLELNEMRVAEDGYYVTVDKVALSAVADTIEKLCQHVYTYEVSSGESKKMP